MTLAALFHSCQLSESGNRDTNLRARNLRKFGTDCSSNLPDACSTYTRGNSQSSPTQIFLPRVYHAQLSHVFVHMKELKYTCQQDMCGHACREWCAESDKSKGARHKLHNPSH
jgi:hypothetical protein